MSKCPNVKCSNVKILKSSNVQMSKCSNVQISKDKYQMSNINKVKLLSEHTSGVPPVIFSLPNKLPHGSLQSNEGCPAQPPGSGKY